MEQILNKLYLTALLTLLWVLSYSQIGYINCSPFPSKCLVVWNQDYKQTKDWLGDDKFWKDSICSIRENFGQNYSFTTYTDGDYPVYIMVFVESPPDSLDKYLLVSHEIIHLMQFLYEAYGVDFVSETESTAYFFEYLVNETYKVINK